MNIFKVVGLIGFGYMLRDTNVLARHKYSYDSRSSLGEYFRELAINKLDIIFYGGERHSKESRKIPYNSGNRYQSYFTNRSPKSIYDPNIGKIARELTIFNTKEKAHAAIDELEEIVNEYGNASVVDWYEIYYGHMPTREVEQMESKFTDNKYGWTDLSNIHIDRLIDDSYQVIFPPIEDLG